MHICTFTVYEMLGTEKGATDKEVKKGYHKMSLKFHPDKNPGMLVNHSQSLHACKKSWYPCMLHEVLIKSCHMFLTGSMQAIMHLASLLMPLSRHVFWVRNA